MPIDLSTVVIHNSPDIRGWAQTATIMKLEFRAGGVHVEHTKNVGDGCWPNFRPPGWDGDLQYTLWLIERIGNVWHASGGIQFWQSCDQNGGAPEGFAAGWFYAADRWAPMTGYQPQPGELVGFLVTAGDARNNGQQTVQERSDIVEIGFPRSGDVYVASAAPPPVDPPVEPTPVPPSGDVERRLQALERKMDELGDRTQLAHRGDALLVTGQLTYTGRVTSKGTL